MSYPIQSMHHPLEQLPKKQANKNKAVETSFQEILQQQQDLKLSKHALQRLQEREIQIDQDSWRKISDKVREAKEKGITDSLVITGQAALLVSAKNNTVVTAMGIQEANSRIFTNINGTIIMNQ
ncbi:TIGR02530 family flagellar biosynthesis protein [Virgibacillus halophilus]|uniref:TIGR02530 family flagellar biosynthesis protein n=1 Tax=Tigheibacillus halophilus TaxID=361280 RepID=A0ABU5CBG7_9BACI|nr:TIGR02530 family flagellar biosynthesis protein [Virgibacillus halophilus]